MPNTLTNLIPSLYAGLDTVSRELTGYVPAVYRDSSVDRAAVGQAVTYPIAPPGNGVDITPAMTIPEPTDQTVGNDSITISKSRAYEFGFVGEERLGLDNNGAGFSRVQADMFAQAVRGLVNEVENDLSVAAVSGASRAYGTPGVAPFTDDTSAVSQLGKILSDNGAPSSDRRLVVNTSAGANLRTLYGINTDRDWSNVAFDQQGVLITPHGMAIRETGQPVAHVAGDASGATTNSAGYSVGDRTITLASAGTGEIKAGDVVTFAGDSNQYLVTDGDDDVSNGGTITIQEPGLRIAIGSEATDITVVSNSEVSPALSDYDAAGVAFYRNSIVLAARPPALPDGGDVATDSFTMVDPVSGMPLEIRVYHGYRKVRFEVGLAWGVKVTQPRHTALLLS